MLSFSLQTCPGSSLTPFENELVFFVESRAFCSTYAGVAALSLELPIVKQKHVHLHRNLFSNSSTLNHRVQFRMADPEYTDDETEYEGPSSQTVVMVCIIPVL